MAIYNFTNGNVVDANQINPDYNRVYTLTGLNTIRQIMDRSIEFSKGYIDGFGDAYTDSNGQLNSVDTSNTTALYDEQYEQYSSVRVYSDDNYLMNGGSDSSQTATFTGNITSPNNKNVIFDKIIVYFNISPLTGSVTINIKKGTSILVSKSENYSDASNVTVYLRPSEYTSYFSDGDSYTIEITLSSSNIESSTYTGSYSGTLFSINDMQRRKVWIYAKEIDDTSGSEVYMNISTGTLSSTISSSIGVPFIADWESGANIQYKLTNGTDDTGWLNAGNSPEIASFTAFSSEPTQLIVKLTPKSTSPTVGYPSIKGFWVYTE